MCLLVCRYFRCRLFGEFNLVFQLFLFILEFRTFDHQLSIACLQSLIFFHNFFHTGAWCRHLNSIQLGPQFIVLNNHGVQALNLSLQTLVLLINSFEVILSHLESHCLILLLQLRYLPSQPHNFLTLVQDCYIILLSKAYGFPHLGWGRPLSDLWRSFHFQYWRLSGQSWLCFRFSSPTRSRDFRLLSYWLWHRQAFIGEKLYRYISIKFFYSVFIEQLKLWQSQNEFVV